MNASLASQIRTEYMKSSILYDRILRARIIPLNKSDTRFSVDINSPSKSLKREQQRQSKLISSERPFKILQNETKIIKIGQVVLEIFNFKD